MENFGANEFSHIPKRVVQHSVYLDNSERQRPALKIGVTLDESRHRNFYSKVADSRGEKYSTRVEGNTFTNGLSEYQNEFSDFKFAKTSGSTRKPPVGTGFQSIQETRDLLETPETKGSNGLNVRENHATMREFQATQPGKMTLTGLFPVTDYSGCGRNIMTEYKRANPPCERGHLTLKDEVAASTAAWKSTLQADFTPTEAQMAHRVVRQKEPPYEGHEESFVQRRTLMSCTQIDYGKDPRVIMRGEDGRQPEPSQLPKRANDFLLQGTTKFSAHPPGYAGSLPKVLRTDALRDYALGTQVRRAHDKEIMRQTYSHELPDYGGQKFPLSATNDRGARHPQWASTTQSGLMQPYTLKF